MTGFHNVDHWHAEPKKKKKKKPKKRTQKNAPAFLFFLPLLLLLLLLLGLLLSFLALFIYLYVYLFLYRASLFLSQPRRWRRKRRRRWRRRRRRSASVEAHSWNGGAADGHFLFGPVSIGGANTHKKETKKSTKKMKKKKMRDPTTSLTSLPVKCDRLWVRPGALFVRIPFGVSILFFLFFLFIFFFISLSCAPRFELGNLRGIEKSWGPWRIFFFFTTSFFFFYSRIFRALIYGAPVTNVLFFLGAIFFDDFMNDK